MKIAWCFAGHVRMFEQCFPTLKNKYINKYQGDIFFHTWNERTSTNPSWWKQAGSPKQPLPRDELLTLVKPTGYLIEESRSLVPIKSDNWIMQNGWSCKCAYESAIKCFNIARNHDKYDVYFILRFDLVLLNDIIPYQIEDNCYLYTPKNPSFNSQGAYSDVFTHGNEENTQKRLEWFFYLDQNVYLNKNASISHEYEMSKYYKQINLPVKISSLEYGLQRDTGKLERFS